MVSKIFEMISIEIVLMILKKISKRFEIVSERFEVVLKRFEMDSERYPVLVIVLIIKLCD